MQSVSFRDKDFSPTDCHLYDLSVHCCPDGLSFLVQQSGSGKLLLCNHYPFRIAGYQMLLRKIQELITGSDFLNPTYRKTTIFFGDSQLSLVPENFWSEKLLEFLFPSGKKFEVETESIIVSLQQMGARLVFKTGKELFETLNLAFPGAEVTHEVYPILQYLHTNPDSRLHFHMHAAWFYALSVKEGKLECINSFDFKNETDMLYYMLSVNKEFNPGNNAVIISGWINPGDSRFNLIQKYLPGVILADQYDGIPLPDGTRVSRYFYGFIHE